MHQEKTLDKMKNKKAQEEIVGFVLIVIIVSIVLVIFLGISLRQDKEISRESRDTYQFLESTMQYTTDCALSYEPAYSKLSELIIECREGLSTCTSNKTPCNVAEETLKNIIESSFPIQEEADIKGYEFKAIYSTNTTEEEIIFINKGNCTISIRGAEFLLPAFPGTISNSLKLCY